MLGKKPMQSVTIKVKLENMNWASIERTREVGKRHLSLDYFEIRLFI